LIFKIGRLKLDLADFFNLSREVTRTFGKKGA